MRLDSKCLVVAAICVLGLSVGAPLHASTLLSVAGPTFFSLGFGSGNGQQGVALGFSVTDPILNVSIEAPISDFDPTTSFTAYLTHTIGSGTTAGDVLAQATVPITPNTTDPNNYQFTTTTLFSGLNLDPGQYYVSLVETDGFNDAGIGLIFSGQQTVTSVPAVQFTGTFSAAQQGGAFAPGFSFSNTLDATLFAGVLAFDVTGTDVTPEPSLCIITGLALGGIALRFRKNRTRKS